MSETDVNKEVMRKIADQVFNRGNIAAIDECYADDYYDNSLGRAQLFGIAPDREGLKKMIASVRAGLSDMTAEIELMAAEGDLVAIRTRGTGTHTGMFMGVPATGKKVEIVDFHFYRLKDGKIVEHWNQYNTLEIMQTLGLIPKKAS